MVRTGSLTPYGIVVLLVVSLVLAALGSGCSVLVGNVRPVEEKSESYGVTDLAKENPAWEKLKPSDVKSPDRESQPTEVSDVAFQSRKSASIISLNSACRPGNDERTLKNLTRELLRGMSGVTLREEKNLTLQNSPALETTVKGKVSGEDVMIRTVVLQRRDCVYDLMFVARPATFGGDEPEFSHFVASLKLKE